MDIEELKNAKQKNANNQGLKEENVKVEPFLKWAGGKRWFADRYLDLFPKKFDRYIEPFVGSGAVFFALKPSDAILADSNRDLIETYEIVKRHWKLMFRYLKKHANLHSEDYYYKIRASAPKNKCSRAARFIYLNRTCWNGLYRVNNQGGFNVPIGTRKEVLRGVESFEDAALALKNAILKTADFEQTINLAGKGDLLFVDPPYTVKHNNNGFIKYNEKIFSWHDQIRLRNSLQKARRRGAHIFVTNAFHKPISDLYKGFFRMKLKRVSTIAANADRRGKTEELLIIG